MVKPEKFLVVFYLTKYKTAYFFHKDLRKKSNWKPKRHSVFVKISAYMLFLQEVYSCYWILFDTQILSSHVMSYSSLYSKYFLGQICDNLVRTILWQYIIFLLHALTNIIMIIISLAAMNLLDILLLWCYHHHVFILHTSIWDVDNQYSFKRPYQI